MLIKKSEKEFKLKMLLKAIVFQLNTHLMMKNSRINLKPHKNQASLIKLKKLKAGSKAINKQILLNMKESLKPLKLFSILLCKRFTVKEELHQEQEDSQEVLVSQEELEASQEDHKQVETQVQM